MSPSLLYNIFLVFFFFRLIRRRGHKSKRLRVAGLARSPDRLERRVARMGLMQRKSRTAPTGICNGKPLTTNAADAHRAPTNFCSHGPSILFPARGQSSCQQVAQPNHQMRGSLLDGTNGPAHTRLTTTSNESEKKNATLFFFIQTGSGG